MTSKPRILIITELYPRFPGNHIGAFVRDQALALRDRFDVTVITAFPAPSVRKSDGTPPVPQYFEDNGIHVYPFAYYPWWLSALLWYKLITTHQMIYLNKTFFSWRMRRLARILHRQHPFHVVHGHETYFGDEAGRIGRQLRIPSFFTLHGLYPEHKKVFGGYVLSAAVKNIRQATVLLADSSVAGATYQPVVGRAFTPLYNGINVGRVEKIPDDVTKFLQGRPYVFSIGAFSPSKRFDVSIQTLLEIHRGGHPEYVLLLVGSGTELQSLRTLISKLHLEQSVYITSGLRRGEVRALFEQSEIVLHPSVIEAFCIVVLEGMAAGKPVVACSNIGIIEYVTPGVDIITVLPNNETAFSTAARELIEQPERRLSLGRAALETSKKFTWDSVAATLTDLYHQHANF